MPLSEVRLLLKTRSSRPPLFSFTETVISALEEEALMDTLPGRPVSESLRPTWEHKDTLKQSFTLPLGAQPTLISLTRTTMPKNMSSK